MPPHARPPVQQKTTLAHQKKPTGAAAAAAAVADAASHFLSTLCLSASCLSAGSLWWLPLSCISRPVACLHLTLALPNPSFRIAPSVHRPFLFLLQSSTLTLLLPSLPLPPYSRLHFYHSVYLFCFPFSSLWPLCFAFRHLLEVNPANARTHAQSTNHPPPTTHRRPPAKVTRTLHHRHQRFCAASISQRPRNSIRHSWPSTSLR